MTREEVARRVADRLGLTQDDHERWWTAGGKQIPAEIVDALISSEMRVEELESDTKFAEKGMPELDNSDVPRASSGARNLLGNSLKQELISLKDLSRWDGPDAAPKRMHEIWEKLSRIIENEDWAAEARVGELEEALKEAEELLIYARAVLSAKEKV